MGCSSKPSASNPSRSVASCASAAAETAMADDGGYAIPGSATTASTRPSPHDSCTGPLSGSGAGKPARATWVSARTTLRTKRGVTDGWYARTTTWRPSSSTTPATQDTDATY